MGDEERLLKKVESIIKELNTSTICKGLKCLFDCPANDFATDKCRLNQARELLEGIKPTPRCSHCGKPLED